MSSTSKTRTTKMRKRTEIGTRVRDGKTPAEGRRKNKHGTTFSFHFCSPADYWTRLEPIWSPHEERNKLKLWDDKIEGNGRKLSIKKRSEGHDRRYNWEYNKKRTKKVRQIYGVLLCGCWPLRGQFRRASSCVVFVVEAWVYRSLHWDSMSYRG